MSRMTKFLLGGLAMAVFLCLGSPASAQTAPDFGAAKSYAVLAGSTVTNTGSTVVTGNLGVSPGAAVTGFPPGTVVSGTIHAADASAGAAQAAVTTAYNALAAQATTSDLTGQDLGGLVLGPGVYNFASSAQLTGTLTLNAGGDPNAVFIFKIGSTLTTASGARVLINGGSACNVFWQVGSSATLGSTTALLGNIVALTSITLNTNASIVGRAFARNGAVTLDTNTVNASACLGAAPCPVINISPATLPSGQVGVAYNQTLTASGGTGPYTFSVQSGTLPAGLTLTAGGVLSGTPTAAGSSTVTIQATDAASCPGVITYTLVISAAACPVITLSPATLPSGIVGVAYSQTITGSGGTAPYTFSVLSGTLPAGLSLSAAGVLSGTPTTVASSTVTIQALDAAGCPGVITYAIVIGAASCPVLTLSPATLPSGIVGTAYTQAITASGGTAPYTFTVLTGTLPAGLSLSAAGVLSGTPTTVGSSTVTIQALDAAGCPGVITYVIVIGAASCPVLTLSPATLPSGIVGTAYSQTITATGGTAPYTFSVLTGTLPAGLSLSAAGVLSGTPTTVGSSTVTIRALDAAGCPAVIAYTITIATPVPTMPQTFAIMLALALIAAAYFSLRKREAAGS
jgi:hypothetical protein